MPGLVKDQQRGFSVASFEYRTMPAMRLVGRHVEWSVEKNDWEPDADSVMSVYRRLDALGDYTSGFDYDVCFMHHFGKGYDVERLHNFLGRFMRTDCPVPDGLEGIDFVPESDGKPGAPYISQFAYATFTGDIDAMHESEGYDGGAMYDVTRNIMLGEAVNIPYPDKYWTAEVFLDGYGKPSTAYMFSAEY
ncbi:MAG: hypothetical protein LBC65_06395 [Oscillospiraceae bacterium]|nr:hypothetical protein [Oscillospiraceae bacterium]